MPEMPRLCCSYLKSLVVKLQAASCRNPDSIAIVGPTALPLLGLNWRCHCNNSVGGASIFFCATSSFPRIDRVAHKARHPFHADVANLFWHGILQFHFARKQHSLQFNFRSMVDKGILVEEARAVGDGDLIGAVVEWPCLVSAS